jgi:ferric-dicitrate binding protein FerR (iron transport regulator)
MKHPVTDIDQQIASVLSGNSNPKAVEELDEWKRSAPENRRKYDDSAKIWENIPIPLSQIKIGQDKVSVQERIIDQTAQLQKRERVLMRFLRVAAIFFSLVMLTTGYYIGRYNQPTKEIAWNTVTAPRKHVAMCTLTDGTEVWLNAGSTLSYSVIDPSDKREVRLTGEGYFKVTKNAKKPFFVITKNATVKVLGTVFDMKAYPGDDRIITTLEEGSIELYTQKLSQAPILLKPGEQISYDFSKGNLAISNVDAKQFSAWRQDKFIFKDADLMMIITELERLYDIKIHINNPSFEKLRFRGMFSYDQDLLDALETIKRSVKLNYTIKGREVWLE